MRKAPPILRTVSEGPFVRQALSAAGSVLDDPASRVFGRHGRRPEPEVINLALGSLRGVPGLRRLWRSAGEERSSLMLGLDHYPGTQGPHSLLEALAELWETERGGAAAAENFVLTHGALDAVGHALATMPAGSPVLFAVPGFDYRLAIARARCRAVPLAWSPGSGLGAFIDVLSGALAKTERPAAIIACIPSNPGGIAASPAEWERLRELTRCNGAVLIVDDLYRFTSTALHYLDDPDFVVVDSLSKRLGAPGLRLGYAKATGARLAQIRASMGQTSVGVSSLVARVAERALRLYLGDPSIAAEIRGQLEERRQAVRDALPAGLRLGLQMTDIGFYGCLQTPGVDAGLLVQRLRERRVLVTAGADLFAALGTSTAAEREMIRFCLGSDARIDEAFEILVETYFELAAEQGAALASVGG